jgi:hypothetical protein
MRIHPHVALCAVLAAGLAAPLAVDGPAHADSVVPQAVTTDVLRSVAVASSSEAWAVGDSSSTGWSQTLIEHWKGNAWKIVASPDPAGSSANNQLDSVAVVSRSNAWAVGDYSRGSTQLALILHWNGRSWKRVPCPEPGGKAAHDDLAGVTATSASSAWAVGEYSRGSTLFALILHWNGRSWRQVTSPLPHGTTGSSLSAVTAISSSDALAVGSYFHGLTERTLIERWNGHAWRLASSRNVAVLRNALNSVTGTSAGNIWAAGTSDNGSVFQTLTEHWNGHMWQLAPSPDPGGSSLNNVLYAVAAASPASAWAAGDYFNGDADQPLIEHWSSQGWQQQPVPDPPGFTLGTFYGAAAAPSGRAWAVGFYITGSSTLTLIEHWNGTSWQVASSPNR